MMTMTDDVLNTESSNSELQALRHQIDGLDEQLLRVLSQRAQLVDEVGRYKKARGLEPLDMVRWQQVLNAKKSRAAELGLCPEFIDALYNLIHEYSLHLESKSE
ncbi:chorismate mutase [Vampirovibrio sp.]|uniref:chorismate mutase n=1 Tax=Vampirovibrio sp. TaxID=2717857 RepID=UPI0035939BC9